MPGYRNVFKNFGIFNSEGERLSHDKLFSKDKQDEMNRYFESTKRGTMVRVFRCNEMGEIEGNGLGGNGYRVVVEANRPCVEGKEFGHGGRRTCMSPKMPKEVDGLTVGQRHPEKRSELA